MAYVQQSVPLARTPEDLAAQANARAGSLHNASVDRRAVGLIVHGIGEQAIGDTLRSIVDEFFSVARTIDDHARIAVTPLDEGDPHEARIWFRVKGKDGADLLYELRFLEVWWAQAFEPVGVGQFLLGTGKLLKGQLKRLGQKNLRFLSGRAYWGPAQWQRAVAEFLVLPLALLALVLLVLARVTQFVIPKDRLPEPLVAVQRIVVNAATRHLGDMWVYMLNPWEASRIRVRFEERFRQLVEIVDQEFVGDPEAPVESVFVIAHSMGSVVAYEGLTGSRITQLIGKKFSSKQTPSLHFISVGSALNWAWEIAPSSERHRFHREFDPNIDWLNVWSGPDPVARGSLDGPTVDASDPECYRQRGRVADQEVSVVNQFDIFSDHSSYWENREQVIGPMLERITGGTIDPPFDQRRRVRRSHTLALLKLLAYVAGISVFVTGLVAGFDGWLLAQLPDDVLSVGTNWLRQPLLTPAIVSAAAAVVASLVYSTLIKWWWSLSKPSDPPATLRVPS